MRTFITRAVCSALAAAALASLGIAGSGPAGAVGTAPQARAFLPSAWQADGTVHPAAGQARPTGPVTAYVVNHYSGTVTPIRTATNTALKSIKVGQSPDAIAITPDAKTAYVANFASGTVTPIRTATNTALRPIAVDGGPTAIAITPDGKTAYVAAFGFGVVTPIRTATNTALTPITVGYGALIAITPDGKDPRRHPP
jgi:YVTN family beta-propeller protein